ncbi:MAG: glycoside hydrolase family 3 C-terminal domain-containing protein [Bacteroidales bacterium]|nr:glycoside hydrolase family 3 C-terminal domain-containing protein [Bacteroidales bacterium]
MRKTFVMTILLAATACAPKPQTPEERARALVSRMNLEEKASLMWYTSAPIESLGIPAYNWWNEALHGVARNGKATTFPQPIGMAASFDTELLEQVFTAASDEARVKNRQALEKGPAGHYQGLTFWTPNINIFRDPRWGRGMETYGEDPYLTGQMGMAVVRGLQGPEDAPVLKTHACAKHFAVHSGPEWNRHQFDAQVSERDLRETYLPAFKDLVTKAGVQEVMIAYNRFRGVPCGANDYLVNTILRGEWGYKGLVVSDCWAVKDFVGPQYHNYVQEPEQAVAAAVHNGTDLECGSLYDRIPDAVAKGLLDEADVDRSLQRILAARIRLGELDGNLGPWADLPDSIIEGPEHLSLARKMAQESLVLLQNKGGILPLESTEGIALMGPNADDREMLWGNYNPIPEFTVTLADALRERIPDLTYIPGGGIVAPGEPAEAILNKLEGIETVIFAGGISPRLEGEEMKVEIPGFKGGDRTSIELPEVQRELLQALHAAGKKVILVNFSGSAIGLEPETESCHAILQAWYPGEEGGNAIADVLLGDIVPSGKLPVTFYKSVEQLPDFEDYSMKGRTYRYFQGEPLFPFGFGLGYTTLEYGKPHLRGRRLSVRITNTGDREAEEVVQLYARNLADTEGPVKSLRGFQRVIVPAGETVRVSFRLTPETFLGWSEEKQDMVPVEGEWELMVGGSSASTESVVYKF